MLSRNFTVGFFLFAQRLSFVRVRKSGPFSSIVRTDGYLEKSM